jgi:hypothetical protein
LLSREKQKGVNVREVFDWMDSSGKGSIGVHQFINVMINLEIPLTFDEAETILERLGATVEEETKLYFTDFKAIWEGEKKKSTFDGDGFSKSGKMKYEDVHVGGETTTSHYWDATEGWGMSEDLPLGAADSVGAFLENSASRVEKKNFFELMALLTSYEQRVGLQQKNENENSGDHVTLNLGSRLKANIRFTLG